MVAHRNVHHFQPKIQQTIHINRTINVQQPKVCSTGCSGGMGTMGSIFMAMSAMNMVGDMLGGILGPRQQMQPAALQTAPAANNNPNQMANLEKLAKGKDYVILDEGNGQFTVSFGDGEPVTGDYATVRDAILAKDAKPSAAASAQAAEVAATRAAAEPDGLGGNEPAKELFDVNEIPDDFESYTIKAQRLADGQIKGDTWSSLALSKYDIPQGVTLKDVYTALAKANYQGDNFAEAMNSKGGIQFKAGDQIKLPKELNINGQIVKLKGDWKASDVRFNYGTVQSNFQAATVKQTGSKWQVVNSQGVQQGGLYNTESDARAAADKLSNGDE